MKKKSILCALAVMGVSTFTSPTVWAQDAGIVIDKEDTTDVEPRTNIIDWRFKVIDGHLYKRLYNYSTQEWIGDWILVQ